MSGGASSSNAGARITSYWDTGTSGSTCYGHAEWADQVCQVTPGTTAPSVGSVVPATTATYNWALQPQQVIESSSASSYSSTELRVTIGTYDASGRSTATRITSYVSGDVAVPDTVNEYSSTTGLPISTSSVPQSDDTISGDTLTQTVDGSGYITNDTSTAMAGLY